MPVLPGYTSKASVQVNTQAPLRGDTPLRHEAAIPFEQDQGVLKTMGDITQKWSDANDVMQYTEAKAKHGVAVADIEGRAAADPNFRNTDKYHQELAAAQKTAVDGISNQQIAAKAGTEFSYDSQIAAIKIGANFKTKQIAYNQVMVKTNLDTLMQSKLSATTLAEAQQYDLKIKDLLTENLQTGTLSYSEADKLLKDSQETSVKYQVYADNATQEKDSQLLKELKDPKGKYSFLEPDMRLKMIEEDQRRIFQNNQTFKREAEVSRDQQFNDIFTKANEGTLTLNDLDAQMAIPEEQGGIPKKQLLEIRKSLQTRIKTDLETIVDNNDKAGEYLKFVDGFISDETDRQKGREAIVNAFKDNYLSPKEASFLNQLKRETEGVQQIKSREEFNANNMVPFKNAVNAVNDFFTGKKNFTESEKALAIKQLLNGSAEGADPAQISQTIIKNSIINKNPSILNLPPEGQIVVDENGFLKIMNNQGDIKDFDSKSPKAKEKK